MELSRNTVRVVMALMAVALCGVLWLQYRLLRNNVGLKEESFEHNVTAALDEASSRLEEVDLRDRFFTSAADSDLHVVLVNKSVSGDLPGSDSSFVVSVMTSKDGPLSSRIRRDTLTYTTVNPQKLTIRVFDELGRLDTTILEQRVEAGTHALPLPGDTTGTLIRFVQIRGEHATSTMRWDRRGGYRFRVDSDEEGRAARLIGRIAETATAGDIPGLSRRVRPGLVDTVLREAFGGNGIDLPYEYAVRESGTDSIVASRMEAGSAVPPKHYEAILFPGGLTGAPGELLVWFPGYDTHMFRSILPELLLNLFFVLVIGACFWYAVRTLRAQKEFAGRLSDFINNMTHEFKTPLSTIALSTEALARPDVLEDRSKTEMYGAIISDEQKRMKSQVDRILEMAALEEGEFEFKRDLLDIHEIASRAAANASLRVKEKGGTLETDFRAGMHAIRGDAVHVENVVNNVLDNAEKYSPGAPEIRISTYNVDGWVVVSVSDRGIGIAPEHMPNIFEKYYRVPTDNIHDVKGFGIGLSYVKLVVERHGGNVRASSAPGQGTTIELRFRAADGR